MVLLKAAEFEKKDREKIAFFNLLFEVFVAGGNEANIQIDRCRSAHTQYLFFLNNMQHFYLHGRGHFSDFIEEKRPSVSRFNETDLSNRCTGKSAFFMAEQFVGNQFFREPPTIERNKRTIFSRAQSVNRSGHKLLSSTAFTLQQDIAIYDGNFLDHREDFLHGGAGSNKAFQKILSVQGFSKMSIFFSKSYFFLRAPGKQSDFVKLERFGYIMIGAFLNGADCRVDGSVTRNDNDLNIIIPFFNLGKDIQPVDIGKF